MTMTFPNPFIRSLGSRCILIDTFHDENAVERFWRKTVADTTIAGLILCQSTLRGLPNSLSFENLTRTITLLPSLERLMCADGTDECSSLILDFLTRQFDEKPRWFNFKSFSLYMDHPAVAVHQQTTLFRTLVSFLFSPAASALQNLDLCLVFHDCEPGLANFVAAAVAALSSKKLDTLSIRMRGDERCISAFVQGLDKSNLRIQNLKMSAPFSSRALVESGLRLINVLRKTSVKALCIDDSFLGGEWYFQSIQHTLSDNQHLSSLYVSLWGELGLQHANTILPYIAAGIRKNCALKHLSLGGFDVVESDLDLTPLINVLVDWSDCPPCLESLVVNQGKYFDSLCQLVSHPKCTLKYLSANEYQPFYRDEDDDTESRLEVVMSQKKFLSCMLENTSLVSMKFSGFRIDGFVNARKNLPFKNALQLIVARNKILHTVAAFAGNDHKHAWSVSDLPLSVFPTALERIQNLPESSPNTPLSSVIATQGRTASVLFCFLRKRVDKTDMMEHIRRHFTNNAAGETTGAGQPPPPVQSSCSCVWKRRKMLNGTV